MHAQMERLYRAAKELGGISSQSELARALNQSPQTLTNWEKRGISRQGLFLASNYFDCSVQWLDNNIGNMQVPSKAFVARENEAPPYHSPSVHIPMYDSIASMGTGQHQPDGESVIGGLDLDKSWIQQNLPHVTSAGNLSIITGKGDSMAPTFVDGDILLIDRGVEGVRIDAVYVISFKNELFIKRLQRRPDGVILMLSDNKTYVTYEFKAEENEQITILGRVVFAWNGKKL
jgi:phage repressor protein C with HTH and peptisase S24 domain